MPLYFSEVPGEPQRVTTTLDHTGRALDVTLPSEVSDPMAVRAVEREFNVRTTGVERWRNQILNPSAAVDNSNTSGSTVRNVDLNSNKYYLQKDAATLATGQTAELYWFAPIPPPTRQLVLGDKVRIGGLLRLPATSYRTMVNASYYMAVTFQNSLGSADTGMYEWVGGGTLPDAGFLSHWTTTVTLGQFPFEEAAAANVWAVRSVSFGAYNNTGSAKNMTFGATDIYAIKEGDTQAPFFHGDSVIANMATDWTGTAHASESVALW